jgi:hypothetical protein
MYEYKYYKLRDWIPIDKLNWRYLSTHPEAISIIEENLDKINWIIRKSKCNSHIRTKYR